MFVRGVNSKRDSAQQSRWSRRWEQKSYLIARNVKISQARKSLYFNGILLLRNVLKTSTIETHLSLRTDKYVNKASSELKGNALKSIFPRKNDVCRANGVSEMYTNQEQKSNDDGN